MQPLHATQQQLRRSPVLFVCKVSAATGIGAGAQRFDTARLSSRLKSPAHACIVWAHDCLLDTAARFVCWVSAQLPHPPHTCTACGFSLYVNPCCACRHEAAVIAALLHDTLDDTPTTVDQISAAFGPAVAAMVVKVSKLSQVNQMLRRDKRKVGYFLSFA